MKNEGIKVEIRPFVKLGSSVRAHADVSIETPEGRISINGFAIIQKDGKPAFVGFPSKQGNVPGRYFPIVDVEGALRETVCQAVLESYRQWTEQHLS